MVINYKELLKSKKFKIGIWGTGYIGLSTMVYFSKKKIKCIGYDIDKSKVRSINSGVIPLKDLKKWFGFNIKNLVKTNYLKATSNSNDLISDEVIAHFIAVPTEKNGKPYYKPLMKVLDNISKIKKSKKNIPPLIIVESTLAPKVSDKKILPFFKKKNLKWAIIFYFLLLQEEIGL